MCSNNQTKHKTKPTRKQEEENKTKFACLIDSWEVRSPGSPSCICCQPRTCLAAPKCRREILWQSSRSTLNFFLILRHWYFLSRQLSHALIYFELASNISMSKYQWIRVMFHTWTLRYHFLTTTMSNILCRCAVLLSFCFLYIKYIQYILYII